MDEKKYKVTYSLSIIIFVIALIVFVALGCWGTLIYKQKENNSAKVSTLANTSNTLNVTNSNTQNKEEESFEEKIISANGNYTELTENITGLEGMYVTDIEKNENTYILKGIMYSEYTFDEEKYNSIVAAGEITLDGKTYTLHKGGEMQGILYELYQSTVNYPLYGITNPETNVYKLIRYAQISEVLKLTDTFGQVTIDPNTEVINDYTNESLGTVTEYFKDFKPENISLSKNELFETTNLNTRRTYKFEFQNGKVTKIYNQITSI